MTAKKCIFCGAKADLLCDHHLGWERMRGQMAKEAPNLVLLGSSHVPLRYRKVHTCDAPLCRACAVRDGCMNFRLRYLGSFSDTIDYCPGHDNFGTIAKEITGLEAEAFRSAWRKAANAARGIEVSTQVDLFGRVPI